MVNIQRLKGKIVEKGFTQKDLAKFIGIDRSTFYRKIKNKGPKFNIDEVSKIISTLNIDKEDAIDIFFNDKSA